MPADDLLQTQRRVFAALSEPIFGASRARSPLPPRRGDVSADFARCADDLISPSATMAPIERLELYHRQVWYRLLDAIAEDFPALRALLGEARFWGLLEAYLEAPHPQSYTLAHLGSGLADFIATDASLGDQTAVASELARIEYAFCAAFEAGERPPVAAAELGSRPLALQPHLSLYALRTNADTLWQRVEDERPVGAAITLKRPRYLAVWRQNFTLRMEQLPATAFTILQAIADSGSLEVAMDRVAGSGATVRRRDLSRVSSWFSDWMARGWICGPR